MAHLKCWAFVSCMREQPDFNKIALQIILQMKQFNFWMMYLAIKIIRYDTVGISLVLAFYIRQEGSLPVWLALDDYHRRKWDSYIKQKEWFSESEEKSANRKTLRESRDGLHEEN